ncbi:MAG: hypothetical protein AAFO04_27665 [Cyanobacteria bacterium J06592_8]
MASQGDRMANGETNQGLKVFWENGKWMIELEDGTIREATPEEIDEAYPDE